MNRRFTVMRSFILVITFVFILRISPTRPQTESRCSSHLSLLGSCAQTETAIFLANDTSSSEQLTITCNPQPGVTFRGWSLSPDGTTTSTVIDTSSSKYTVNGNTLTISNVSSTDEGLYHCIYDQGQSAQLCVYIYARAVFASCPFDFAGCTGEPTPLSVEEGESVIFNATVIHIQGGSCGFQQEIIDIHLVKINTQFGVDDESLLICAIGDSLLTPCHNGRVSLSRGNDPGLEFMFMLADAVADMDSSLYKVTVDMRDPRTNIYTALSKTFRLEVEKSSEGPQDEVSTSHSMTILKANSTIAILMSCAVALLVLMYASRSRIL